MTRTRSPLRFPAIVNPGHLPVPAVLAVISGLMLAAAHPPFGLGFLAWIGLVPLLLISLARRPLSAFVWAWAGNMIFHSISLYWLVNHPDLSWPVWILVAAVLSLFAALPYPLVSVIADRSHGAALVVFPFALAGFEWIGVFDQFAFPWLMLGNSQTAYTSFIQFADLFGVYGVSWWVAGLNAIVAGILLRPRSLGRWVTAAIFIVVPLLYAAKVLPLVSAPKTKPIRIALIQGNVPIEEKWGENMAEWNINLYEAMSREAMAYHPGLIVWPETATPEYVLEVSYYSSKLHDFVDSLGVPVLTGLPTIDLDTGETWNSAGLFLPGEETVRLYHKMQLVPFGEAFPYDNIFPALRRIELGQANWSEGNEYVVFEPPNLPRFSTAICFESIFPQRMRRFVAHGSEMLVIITNDAWFGPWASPIQHAMISVLRAVETRRPVVRCANTGISMFVDTAGRITKQTEPFERTIIVDDVYPSNTRTVFVRWGYIFGPLTFIVAILTLLSQLTRRLRHRLSPTERE